MSMPRSTSASPALFGGRSRLRSEMARLHALLSVTKKELEDHRRLLTAANGQLTGYTLNPDGSVSLHFAERVPLTDMLMGSLALSEAERIVDSVRASCDRLFDTSATPKSAPVDVFDYEASR